ncbi:DUF6192 family protein [Streptomyces sp. CL12]|uniref:DUF6192 family protein n=1 Tax=Streptomyces sp. CL12 TaxID=3391744 RepID=UPI003A809616
MTRRKLIPQVWYCKYCYRRREIDIGPDGSIIICVVCGYGLAPIEEVFAAGSMLTWWEEISDDFYARQASYYAKRDRHDAARFFLGDLALERAPIGDALACLGQKLAKFSDSVGVSPGRMSQYRHVAAAWPKERRSGTASWSVHAILAAHPNRFELIRQPPLGLGQYWTCEEARKVMGMLRADNRATVDDRITTKKDRQP